MQTLRISSEIAYHALWIDLERQGVKITKESKQRSPTRENFLLE